MVLLFDSPILSKTLFGIQRKMCIWYPGYNFQWIEWLDNIIIGP